MSSPFLGFVLVTHDQPEQVAYLCRTLSSMFGDPPIAIHHDYGKCYLDPATLPSQVRLVKEWVETSWGGSSVIDAYLAGLKLLHATDPPEWTVSLSGADYPVKSAEYIINDLRSAAVDAFLDFREVGRNLQQPKDARSHASTFQQPEWMVKAYERYLSFSMVHYHLRKLVGRENRCFYVSGDLLTHLFTPFSDTFRPYAGDWWHTINRRAAAILLAKDSNARKLRHFYRSRPSAEESYYHTLLLNRPGIRIENDNRRYTLWARGAAHPKLLDYEDVPAMVASNAHFARKFPFQPKLYEAVDAQVRATQGERV